MATNNEKSLFDVTLTAKAKASKIASVTVRLKAQDDESAITIARQHTLMSVDKWNATAEKVA